MSRVDVDAGEAGRGPWARARTWIENPGPYQSLLLLIVPVCLVEPMKLAAMAIAGEGHWITGTGMIVGAYAASLLLIEPLFLIVKPKLLTLPRFASAWARFGAPHAAVTRPIGWERRHPMEQSHERLL